MTNIFPYTLENRDSKMPLDVAEKIFGDITVDEVPLRILYEGPWGMPKKCEGYVIHSRFDIGQRIIYGRRSMFDIRQAGYGIDGRISLNGKKCSCFTSSTIIELENGHLINVQIIFPKIEENQK